MYCKIQKIMTDDVSRVYIQEKVPFIVDHKVRTENKNWFKNIIGTLEFLMKNNKQSDSI